MVRKIMWGKIKTKKLRPGILDEYVEYACQDAETQNNENNCCTLLIFLFAIK